LLLSYRVFLGLTGAVRFTPPTPQTSYQKQFDRHRQQFVYILASDERDDVVVYDCKPQSLFDCDVPLPTDEWKPVVDRRTERILHYANAYRGMTNRFDDAKV
jgi:hypothetical protein